MVSFHNVVVRGKIKETSVLNVEYIAIKVMVQLVMKNTHKYLTPGNLDLVVPLRDWMCECPGADELRVNENYLITGKVHKSEKLKSNKLVLRVNHHSLVRPWKEEILLDMEENGNEYHKLKFRPNLRVYYKYFT